ncbi:MAG TPA: hypothetical protein DET40_21790 [Lentisphaeria bacterium]|nr:MAG: hypothetical protein A2X45_14185 [Lentisphaerae bacterium GWF2_50_93]HCE46186.1 hypothetical protein [Lentisphaeria bacterium]
MKSETKKMFKESVTEVQAEVMDDNVLTVEEERKLEECEAVLAKGIDTIAEMAEALKQIKERKLYRRTHSNFKDYCKAKWDKSAVRIYQIINSGEVAKRVNNCLQSGVKSPKEAHLRELGRLPEEQQAQAWDEAVKNTPEGEKTTAKDVKAVVDSKLANVVKDAKTDVATPENIVETPVAEEKTIPPLADVPAEEPTPKTDETDSVTLPREVVKFLLENMIETAGDDFTKLMETYPEASEVIMSIA